MPNISTRLGKKGTRAIVSLSSFGLVLVLVLAGAGAALAASSFTNNVNDWAPCSGYNHWYDPSPGGLANGSFVGYQYDQAQTDLFCNPDTTEHEVQSGFYSSTTLTATRTQTYYFTAYFDGGPVGVYASESQCYSGYAHAWFELGGGVKDTGTGGLSRVLIYQSY